MLTAEKLRELLDYDPETGIFTWRAKQPISPHIRTWNTKWAGKLAGSPKQGYIKIKISGVFHNAHRLAWLHATGEWPQGLLDHQDKDGSNNRIRNLRPATSVQNAINRKPRKKSISGLRGVSWRKEGVWQAAIGVGGKLIYLGRYAEKAEAADAYARAAVQYYGDFAP